MFRDNILYLYLPEFLTLADKNTLHFYGMYEIIEFTELAYTENNYCTLKVNGDSRQVFLRVQIE